MPLFHASPGCLSSERVLSDATTSLSGHFGLHANTFFTLHERLGTRAPASTATPTPQQQKRHREAALPAEPHLARRGRERRVWDHQHLVSKRRPRERTRHPVDARWGGGGTHNKERKWRGCVRIDSRNQPTDSLSSVCTKYLCYFVAYARRTAKRRRALLFRIAMHFASWGYVSMTTYTRYEIKDKKGKGVHTKKTL